jgi:hypothetical protein
VAVDGAVQTGLPCIVRQERRKAMYIVEWEMDLLMRLFGDSLCLGLREGHVGHRTSDVHTWTSSTSARRGLSLDRAQARARA